MKALAKLLLMIGLMIPAISWADNAAGVAAINAGNYPLAFKLFQEAAAQGDSQATYNLGLMYDDGLYVDRDYKKAQAYYLQAAHNGNPKAMANLAFMYANGHGVQQNFDIALVWYQRALHHGLIALSAENIAKIYYFGQSGKLIDYTLAKHYFLIAQSAGSVSATYYLGQIYLQGQGVPPDYQQAYNYFYKAKLLGDAEANQGLATLYAKLTPQQIQQLQNGTFQMSEVGQKLATENSRNPSLIQQISTQNSK